ncbi:GNAT family N-acetyltransferase [Cohnella candidum]|uniref:N-acetyltransferase n=1 Tax=Cohnella candidum TaxID=2674991 RepID=A0A3G3JW55_9BACL|nr:GNAT family N-acetyltransferase [Cohnella candidum]AYQ72483.1 N-acetyltransferase [Cohnella candidum]
MNHLLDTKTDRLYIRPYRTDDFDKSFSLMQDKDLYRFLHFDVMNYVEYQGLFNWLIQSYESKGMDFKYSFAIILNETNQLIGWVGVGNLDFLQDEKEIYYLVGQDHWGKGFAYEAAQEVVNYSFNTLGLSRVVAKVAPENLASKRIIEKLGFKFEYELNNLPEEHAECNGELLYSLDKQDFSS